MDQTREVNIHRGNHHHPSFGLKDSSFEEEGEKVELQETVVDHDNRDSFTIISKRKRDYELEESGSDHNQQRSFPWRISNSIVPKKARSSLNNSSVRKKTSNECSSSTTEEHIETEIAELLYELKSSRNQDSSEELQANGVYEKNKVEDKNSSTLASRSSTVELVKIGREKLDDDDTKSYFPDKDITNRVNLESIDLMAPPSTDLRLVSREFESKSKQAPPSTDLRLGNNINKIEDMEETKMEKFKKNQHVIELPIKKDNHILTNHQENKTVSPAWSRNLPPRGFVPQPLQPMVKTEKTIGSTSIALKLVDFVLSPPRPKRCASHYYIAHNIFLHQQLLRVNNNSSPSCGMKPSNVNHVPTPESMITGKQSQVKEELAASKFLSLDTNKGPDASNSVDSMQMEKQGPSIMHQPYSPAIAVTSHERSGNSSCAAASKNSISSFAASLVRDASPSAQNSSISIGLSSSHKQSSHGVQVKANNMFPHKLMSETCVEKSPSTVGQKNVYSQNLKIPIQPKNFGDKKKEDFLKGGFELVSSQSFAISFQSQPSVAWQGYYSAWTTQDNEKKVNSGKPSSTNNGPTTLVFDDSSKYLSFVLSPKNRTWLDHSMVSTTTTTSSSPIFSNTSSSQHLLQLHKQHNMQQQQQQQQQTPIVTQYKASNSNSPNNPSFDSKSSRRPLDSQHCFSGEARKSFTRSSTHIFWGEL